jgi:hypothetical protein
MSGIDPKYIFWLGILVTIQQGFVSGTLSFTDMFPGDWIPYIVAWNKALAFGGVAIMTALTGISSAAKGPLIK